jgi:hypothetical protein
MGEAGRSINHQDTETPRFDFLLRFGVQDSAGKVWRRLIDDGHRFP